MIYYIGILVLLGAYVFVFAMCRVAGKYDRDIEQELAAETELTPPYCTIITRQDRTTEI